MKILALEFSSPQRSAAVVDGASRPRPLCLGEAIETGGRSTDALGLVEEACGRRGSTARKLIAWPLD